jgi:hypothetical protein
MSLLLHNAKTYPSFAKYISKEQERLEIEKSGIVPDPISPRSMKISGDARVVEQQQLACDALYELTKQFVYKTAKAPDFHKAGTKLSKTSKLTCSFCL